MMKKHKETLLSLTYTDRIPRFRYPQILGTHNKRIHPLKLIVSVTLEG